MIDPSSALPTIELLEARRLLSGDVTVRLRGSTLFVEGGDGDQVIRLDRKGLLPGGVRISGDADTTINGQNTPISIPEHIGRVQIDLGDGDDHLTIRRVKLYGHCTINLDSGNDTLRLEQSQLRRSIYVNGDDGNDSASFRGSVIGGNTSIAGDGGADFINLGASTFGTVVDVLGGDGDDYVGWSEAVVPLDFAPDFGADEPQASTVNLSWDFRNGEEGWHADFADYLDGIVGEDVNGNPIFPPEAYQFDTGIRALPAELNDPGTGFLLSGKNISDDLFMYLKRSIGAADGLIAGQTYELEVTITFASNAPTGATGAGGPPGEAVFLKGGGGTIEPLPFVDKAGFVRLNVNKTSESLPGYLSAASTMGNIANGLTHVNNVPTPYVSLTRTHTHVVPVTADAAGNIWLLAGTDSGFEFITAVYYQQIAVKLTPLVAGG